MDHNPFSKLPTTSIDLSKLPICTVCKKPVPTMNSVSEYEAYFDKHGGLGPDSKHLLRVIIGGKIICSGSPSRAQYIYLQPQDSRPKYAADLSQVNIHHGRSAFEKICFADAIRGTGKMPRFLEESQSCPSCKRQAMVYRWGSQAKNWIIQLYCPVCDPEDIVRPIFAVPFPDSHGIAEKYERLDENSIGLLGLGALRVSFAVAKTLRTLPVRNDVPEYSERQKEVLKRYALLAATD